MELNQIHNHIPHLSRNEITALEEFVRLLNLKFSSNLVKIALFGPKARGDFSADSDIDVLVVLTQLDCRTQFEVSKVSSLTMIKYNIPLIATTLSLEEYKNLIYGFSENLEKGITLWVN